MPTTTDQQISEWIDASELTPAGAMAYASLIRRLVRFLGQTPLGEVTEQQLTAFFKSIPSDTTRQRATSAARSFFAYLYEQAEIRSNPMGGIRFRHLREHNVLADVRLARALEADGVPRGSIEKLRWADYVLPTTDPDLPDGQHRLRLGRRVLTLSLPTGNMLERRFTQFAGYRKATDVLGHLNFPIFPAAPARRKPTSTERST